MSPWLPRFSKWPLQGLHRFCPNRAGANAAWYSSQVLPTLTSRQASCTACGGGICEPAQQ
ncbi:hypothetical protein ACKKBG_A22930 [Auxenochlorella protothecoides x Auxenochlorella symbiontica]